MNDRFDEYWHLLLLIDTNTSMYCKFSMNSIRMNCVLLFNRCVYILYTHVEGSVGSSTFSFPWRIPNYFELFRNIFIYFFLSSKIILQYFITVRRSLLLSFNINSNDNIKWARARPINLGVLSFMPITSVGRTICVGHI